MYFHLMPPCHQSLWNATLHKHCCLWGQLPSFRSNACFANCVAGLWIFMHAQAITTRSKLQLGWEQLEDTVKFRKPFHFQTCSQKSFVHLGIHTFVRCVVFCQSLILNFIFQSEGSPRVSRFCHFLCTSISR